MTKIAIVDIETTGFLKAGGLIVEVGITGLDLVTGELTEVYNQVVKPYGFGEKHRDSWIFSNSDLTFEEVMAAPPLGDEIPKIQAAIDEFEAGSTAFNRKFDFDFLKGNGVKAGKLLPCIMLAATPIVKAPYPSGRKGIKWPKVEQAWAFFFPDVPYIEKHRGFDDSKHEAMILHEMYKRGQWVIPVTKDDLDQAISGLIFELSEAGIYILHEERSPEGYHNVAKAACKLDKMVFDYKEFK